MPPTIGGVIVAASFQNAAKEQNRRRGATLGFKYTAGLASIVLDVTRDFKNEWGSQKYTNVMLEGKYALSKQSFLYAVYRRLDSKNDYFIGIRHNF